MVLLVFIEPFNFSFLSITGTGIDLGFLWYWMVCLGNEQRSFCSFWDCIQVLYFRLFCWLWWLLHFFWGFLPTIVDIHPVQSIWFVWFLKCQCSSCHLLFDHFQFTLIHGANIPGSYAILLFTASDLASITSHIHNWLLFLLWLHPFILSEVNSPLISSSILGT